MYMHTCACAHTRYTYTHKKERKKRKERGDRGRKREGGRKGERGGRVIVIKAKPPEAGCDSTCLPHLLLRKLSGKIGSLRSASTVE